MNRNALLSSSAWAVGCGLLLLACTGCRDQKESYDKYVPTDEVARKSLEAALSAWQKGSAPGRIETGPPAVQVVDSRWRAGPKLARYQILSMEPGVDGSRWFSVRLTLTNQSAEQTVRYAVVGRDPIWVYREEDYKRATGM